ncbi:hypothetical protein SKB0092_05460 [Roseomonas mucosa]
MAVGLWAGPRKQVETRGSRKAGYDVRAEGAGILPESMALRRDPAGNRRQRRGGPGPSGSWRIGGRGKGSAFHPGRRNAGRDAQPGWWKRDARVAYIPPM